MPLKQRVTAVFDVLAAVSVILASTTFMWILVAERITSRSTPNAGNGQTSIRRTSQYVEDISRQNLRLNLLDAAVLNPQKGTLTLAEFSDFQCPYCARYANETFPLIRGEFVESQKIAYAFLHFPLETIHGKARYAATASLCAHAQDRFWELHDVLFRRPQVWTPDTITETARDLKIDTSRFARCIDGRTKDINAFLSAGKRLGVRSTPTFFIGSAIDDGSISVLRRISGAQPIEVFRNALNELLKTQ